jgi:hypothetical protein
MQRGTAAAVPDDGVAASVSNAPTWSALVIALPQCRWPATDSTRRNRLDSLMNGSIRWNGGAGVNAAGRPK